MKNTYGSVTPVRSKTIVSFRPLLQKNYGGPNDCTLTSITALGSFKEKYARPIKGVYLLVEKVAKNYFYSAEKFGTIPVFIKYIINKTFSVNSHSHYGKGVGFNWNTIKQNINNNVPMILSLWNDGRNYYTQHSIIIIGYREYANAKMLAVYDNWYDSVSYVDYNKLSTISCINYF